MTPRVHKINQFLLSWYKFILLVLQANIEPNIHLYLFGVKKVKLVVSKDAFNCVHYFLEKMLERNKYFS